MANGRLNESGLRRRERDCRRESQSRAMQRRRVRLEMRRRSGNGRGRTGRNRTRRCGSWPPTTNCASADIATRRPTSRKRTSSARKLGRRRRRRATLLVPMQASVGLAVMASMWWRARTTGRSSSGTRPLATSFLFCAETSPSSTVYSLIRRCAFWPLPESNPT